jgi:hypothetical protein
MPSIGSLGITYAFQRRLSSSAGLLIALGGSTCKTYASAIAHEELAISATAGAHPPHLIFIANCVIRVPSIVPN